MIAAIYARKSTDQSGVADEAKSVRRQIDRSRDYAQRKGCTVDESLIFVDDGISGAEFANRPGFVRLMNALKPRPPFQVLIMSEESRLGREAIDRDRAHRGRAGRMHEGERRDRGALALARLAERELERRDRRLGGAGRQARDRREDAALG